MKRAAFLAAAALLVACASAGFSNPAYPQYSSPGPRNVLDMGTVVGGVTSGLINLPGRITSGKFVVKGVGKATPKVPVTDVGCLNTVIPPPLNWGPLYCAGRDANVTQWTDEVGSLHRTVSIPVQPGVTANMVIWLFSPLFPQFLEFKGKMWYWYHLWHPLDHVNAANKIAPSSGNIGMPGLYTLIHERYRNLPAEQGKIVYETDAWFHVEDLMSNFLKKRVVIAVNTAGMQAWTLTVNLKDTPEGLKIDNELIIGAAVQGYDKYDPAKGAPPEAAVLVNENLVKPMFANYAEGAEFDRSINAITRHVIEEFSMFRFFLPEVWERYPQVHPIFNLMDTTTKNWPRLNYGPFMAMKPGNMAGLTEMAAPLNGTNLKSINGMVSFATKAPGAIVSGLSKNLQESARRWTKDSTILANAAIAKNATELAKLAIPSATALSQTWN